MTWRLVSGKSFPKNKILDDSSTKIFVMVVTLTDELACEKFAMGLSIVKKKMG